MSQEVLQLVKDATNKSLKWAEDGWKMTFGPRQTPVCSLKEANALPDTFSFKIEAITFWDRVKQAGEEAASWGEKAIDALQKGDTKGASDCVYYAYYTEKFYANYLNMWKDVNSKLKN